MVPGINTDVTRDGVVYHVQTEDLGAKNPIFLTLVYRSGAVVLRETLDYGHTLATEPSPSLLRALMDAQHRRVTRHVSDGGLEARAPGPEEPTAASTSKTVDALIEEYLCSRRREREASAAHRKP